MSMRCGSLAFFKPCEKCDVCKRIAESMNQFAFSMVFSTFTPYTYTDVYE